MTDEAITAKFRANAGGTASGRPDRIGNLVARIASLEACGDAGALIREASACNTG
jgi:hypothetical protein